jgi:hypothetical protein
MLSENAMLLCLILLLFESNEVAILIAMQGWRRGSYVEGPRPKAGNSVEVQVDTSCR